MKPQKLVLTSHAPSAATSSTRSDPPNLTRYPAEDGYRTWLVFLVILVALGGAALALAQEPSPSPAPRFADYKVI